MQLLSQIAEHLSQQHHLSKEGYHQQKHLRFNFGWNLSIYLWSLGSQWHISTSISHTIWHITAPSLSLRDYEQHYWPEAENHSLKTAFVSFPNDV